MILVNMNRICFLLFYCTVTVISTGSYGGKSQSSAWSAARHTQRPKPNQINVFKQLDIIPNLPNFNDFRQSFKPCCSERITDQINHRRRLRYRRPNERFRFHLPPNNFMRNGIFNFYKFNENHIRPYRRPNYTVNKKIIFWSPVRSFSKKEHISKHDGGFKPKKTLQASPKLENEVEKNFVLSNFTVKVENNETLPRAEFHKFEEPEYLKIPIKIEESVDVQAPINDSKFFQIPAQVKTTTAKYEESSPRPYEVEEIVEEEISIDSREPIIPEITREEEIKKDKEFQVHQNLIKNSISKILQNGFIDPSLLEKPSTENTVVESEKEKFPLHKFQIQTPANEISPIPDVLKTFINNPFSKLPQTKFTLKTLPPPYNRTEISPKRNETFYNKISTGVTKPEKSSVTPDPQKDSSKWFHFPPFFKSKNLKNFPDANTTINDTTKAYQPLSSTPSSIPKTKFLRLDNKTQSTKPVETTPSLNTTVDLPPPLAKSFENISLKLRTDKILYSTVSTSTQSTTTTSTTTQRTTTQSIFTTTIEDETDLIITTLTTPNFISQTTQKFPPVETETAETTTEDVFTVTETTTPVTTTEEILETVKFSTEGYVSTSSEPSTTTKSNETVWKNSRKMHFEQKPGKTVTNKVAHSKETDQRRSDILVSDYLEDYVDDENKLSTVGYLQKIKKNTNMLPADKKLNFTTLLPHVPAIINDLRDGKLQPDDISFLSKAFGRQWEPILALSNYTSLDMLPFLKMRDEKDFENILHNVFSEISNGDPVDDEYNLFYDYGDEFKNIYSDLLDKDFSDKKIKLKTKRSSNLETTTTENDYNLDDVTYDEENPLVFTLLEVAVDEEDDSNVNVTNKVKII